MKRLTKIFLLLFLIMNFPVAAQVSQQWVRNYSYSSSTDEYMADMKMDELGNIYICGWVEYAPTNRDYLLLKYSNNGQLLWSAVHDRTWADRFNSLQLDNEGNVYAFGGTIGVEHVLIKYDPTGSLIWERNIDSIFIDTTINFIYAGISSRFIVDDIGNAYLTGTTRFNGGNMLTMKYDSSGAIIWDRIFKSLTSGHAGGSDVKLKDNILYVVGASIVGGLSGRDITVVKYDTAGLLLDTIYCDAGSSNEGGSQIVFDTESNMIIGGPQTNPGTFRDILIAKIDTLGNKLWYQIFDNNNSQNTEEELIGIKVDESNNIYLLCRATYQQEPPLSPKIAYTIIKYNPDGDSLWTRKYFPVANSSNIPGDFVLDQYGNAYITGFSDFSQLNTRISTVKYSPSGEKLWNIEFYSLFTNSQGKRILLDNENNMYVGGITTAFGNGWNVVLIKYNLLTNISSNGENEIETFALYQNYPNPFNPLTTITFSIPHSGRVQLNIYNALGQLVSTPVSELKQPGTYSVTFEASDLPSGVYYYKLDIESFGETGNYSQTRKMILLK